MINFNKNIQEEMIIDLFLEKEKTLYSGFVDLSTSQQ